jgi:hypothetical protein
MSFENQALYDTIFFMKRISKATSIIAQKVDGLKYVRCLNEFKEKLTIRNRNGFFNTSFPQNT